MPEAERDMVVMGASAGGVEAYQRVLSGLPENFPAAVCLVLHVGSEAPSALAQVLGRYAKLPVIQAEDGAQIRPAHVYVAPADHHLLIDPGKMRVLHGPKENRHRPSIDVLFRSAANAYGSRVIGVVLTGSLDDGTAGLQAIMRNGGKAIVQHPDDALFPSMPLNAIELGPEYVVPLAEIPDLLIELTAAEVKVPAESALPKKTPKSAKKVEVARMGLSPNDEKPGDPSPFSCPECSGVLWEARDGKLIRFECRVGHAYSMASLVEEHGDTVERALWIALRSLDEGASIARRMAANARERKHAGLAKRYEEQARSKEEHASVLRQVLLGQQRIPADEQAKPA